MIAVCPKCTARYRVADEQLAKGELRLRCTRCEAVFRVRAPSGAAPVATTQPLARPSATPLDAASFGTARAGEGSSSLGETPAPAAAVAVLVAHPDPEAGKRIAARLTALGLAPLLAHDGVEAVLLMQRRLPPVAVLDAALQGISTSQLCELVKRNTQLRSIRLVVTGEGSLRSDRMGAEGFEPDRMIARDRLEQEIEGVLRAFDLPLAPRTAPTPTVAPAHAPAAPPAGPEDPLAAERAKAERLARIIVSDVVLYNEAKFTQAIAEGRVLERLDEDLTEGRTLFRQRIDARVREERDFLGDELLRVASTRGARGPA